MEDVTKMKVTAADRLDGSVIITFYDGRVGIYSSELLRSMLASAQELRESDDIEVETQEGN